MAGSDLDDRSTPVQPVAADMDDELSGIIDDFLDGLSFDKPLAMCEQGSIAHLAEWEPPKALACAPSWLDSVTESLEAFLTAGPDVQPGFMETPTVLATPQAKPVTHKERWHDIHPDDEDLGPWATQDFQEKKLPEIPDFPQLESTTYDKWGHLAGAALAVNFNGETQAPSGMPAEHRDPRRDDIEPTCTGPMALAFKHWHVLSTQAGVLKIRMAYLQWSAANAEVLPRRFLEAKYEESLGIMRGLLQADPGQHQRLENLADVAKLLGIEIDKRSREDAACE